MDENFKTYKAAIERYYQGLKYFYPKRFDSNYEGWIAPPKDFVYNGQKITRSQFIEEILKFTNAKDNLAAAIDKIIELHRLTDQELALTVPQNLEDLLRSAEKKKIDVQRINAEQKASTDANIKLQKEAIENLKKLKSFQKANEERVVYAEVKNPEEPKLSQKQEEKLSNLKEAAIEDPDGTTEIVTAEVYDRLKVVGMPGATDEEMYSASFLTAQNIVGALSNKPPIIGVVALKQSANVGDFKVAKDLLTKFSESQIQSFAFSKDIASQTLGKEFADRVFWIPESVNTSSTPAEGFTPFAVSKIINSEPSVVLNTSAARTETGHLFLRQVSRPQLGTPLSSGRVDNFGLRNSMSGFNPNAQVQAPSSPSLRVEAPKVSLPVVPLNKAVSGIGKVFSDLLSKGKIAIKGLENSQGVMVLGGAALAVAGGLSGNIFLTVSGTTSTVTGFAINPGRVFDGSAFSDIVAPIAGLFGTLLGGVLTTIILPVIITIVCVPVVIAIIAFIINSGAYIVPPGQQFLSEANPYILVQKTASPSGKVPSPTTITYTIMITAKKDVLTQISFKNDCHAIKKGGATMDCKNLEQIPDLSSPINPGTPKSFTFTSNYDSRFQDALVSNTFTVSAKSNEGGQVSDTGSSSVCFGDCPLNCFDFSDPNWSQNPTLQSLLTEAAGRLVGEHSDFVTKVCPADGPPVKICYTTTDPGPGGCSDIFAKDVEQKGGCTINFNKCVGSSQYLPDGPLFLLTHEVTHHIQNINGHWRRIFDDKVYPTEPSVCTYGGSNPDESMAEGDALFVAKPVIDQNSSCLRNFQSQYPKHYDFAKNVMFGP